MIKKRLGITLKLYPKDWLDNRLLAQHPFEYEQLSFAMSLIQKNSVEIFYDCGANIGLYSCFLGVHCPTLQHIHAFEPLPPIYKRLEENLALNDIHACVHLYNLALGDSKSTLSLTYFINSSGTSTSDVHAIARQTRKHTGIAVDVPVIPLDSLELYQGKSIFLKIDVEGFELSVLKGMNHLLQHNRCFLQVELWDENASAFIESLSSMGFVFIHQVEYDYYFVKT